MLATIKRELGDLDRVKQVVRLFGMVNCTPEFTTMPRVIDGASDLFYELYGPQAGCHARTAVGMASLPRGQAVEINGEFEIVV
jgi:enamine deaminase RidA (YjgF/YER057c/UK114 family)